MDQGETGRRVDRELDATIEGCAAAHQRLLADVDTLTDEDIARPSTLPDWTIGHVLTHLARNADSHIRVYEAAARGVPTERYPGGQQGRNVEIETGAARPAAEQIAGCPRHHLATGVGVGGRAGRRLGADGHRVRRCRSRWSSCRSDGGVRSRSITPTSGAPTFTIDDWSDELRAPRSPRG